MTTMINRGYMASALCAVMFSLSGCAGDGQGLGADGQPANNPANPAAPPPAAPAIQPTLTSIQANVFSVSCAECHIGAGAPQGLDLSNINVSMANLVGVASNEIPAILRVATRDPDNSYLIQKLEGAPNIVGGQMPLGRAPLPQATINVVRQWILDGAPQ